MLGVRAGNTVFMDDADETPPTARTRKAAADVRHAQGEAREAAGVARAAQEQADRTEAQRQVAADGREDIADERDAEADAREANADIRDMRVDARVADADARIARADASIAEAQAGLSLARDHMNEARSHMATVGAREDEVFATKRAADEQLARAASAIAAAANDSAEYERAVYHYTQLVRHRMANPLQTISGMAQTLLDLPSLDQQQRVKMVEAIRHQARVLSDICLDPEVRTEAEEPLHPRPFE